jgi:hypothetical protein
VCGLWLTSNEAQPMPIELDDRRFLVFRSPAQPWPVQRYLDLGAWLKAGDPSGYELVGEFLYRRWEGMDEARRQAVLTRAPSTEAKTELARSSRSPAAIWLENVILAEPPSPDALPDLVSAEGLVKVMAKAVEHSHGLSPDTLGSERRADGGRLARGRVSQRLHGGEQVQAQRPTAKALVAPKPRRICVYGSGTTLCCA